MSATERYWMVRLEDKRPREAADLRDWVRGLAQELSRVRVMCVYCSRQDTIALSKAFKRSLFSNEERHVVTKYFFGHRSSKRLTVAQSSAVQLWLSHPKTPDHVQEEIARILRAAQEEAGQLDMFKVLDVRLED